MILRISVGLLVFLACGCPLVLGQPSIFQRVANDLPANTHFVIHCDDVPDLCSRFLETALFRAFLETPKIQEWKFLIKELETFQAEQAKRQVVDSQSPIEQFVHGFFGGQFTYASFHLDDAPGWILIFELNPDNPFTKTFIQELNADQRWGLANYQPEGERQEWKKILDPQDEFTDDQVLCGLLATEPLFQTPPQRVAIAMTPERMVVAPRGDVLAHWLAWSSSPEVPRQNSLAGTRKFQQLERQLSLGARSQPIPSDVYMFANSLAIAEKSLAQNPNHEDWVKQFRDIGGFEILGWGGRLSLGTDIADYDIELWIGLGLPRVGIFELLDLSPLREPVQPHVPGDVDYYLQAIVDLHKIQQIEDVISDLPNELSNAIDGLISTAFNTISHYSTTGHSLGERLKDCTGLVEVIGFECNNVLIPQDRSVIRYRLKDNKSVIADVITNTGGPEEWIQKNYKGVDYFVASEEKRKRSHEYLSRIFKMAGCDEIDRVSDACSGFTEFDIEEYRTFVDFWQEDAEVPSKVIDPPVESLADNESVRILWREFSRKGRPGFFAYVRHDSFTKSFFHGQASTHFIAATHQDLLRRLEEEGREDAVEYRLHKHIVDSLPDWSREKYKSHFGAGGLAIYQTDSGYRVRLIQLAR